MLCPEKIKKNKKIKVLLIWKYYIVIYVPEKVQHPNYRLKLRLNVIVKYGYIYLHLEKSIKLHYKSNTGKCVMARQTELVRFL